MEHMENIRQRCSCSYSTYTARWKCCNRKRFRAWQPIATSGCTAASHFLMGLIFLVIGVFLFVESQAVVELRYDYTDDFEVNEHGTGYFDIEVDTRMVAPIWVYYELNGFHQNHMRYITSRDDRQLRVPGSIKSSQRPKACRPWLETDDRLNYPCGLVAKSVFNDSFSIFSNASGALRRLEVDSHAEVIAWTSDVDLHENLDPEAATVAGQTKNEHALNMWLLKRFPPMECVQVELGAEQKFVPAKVATRLENTSTGEVEVLDCMGYTGGKTSCHFTREDKPFECNGNYEMRPVQDWGVESGHFLVWMRAAAFPDFRKVWGKVDSDIQAGTRLRVFVEDNFPVRPFRGRKAFVMSTSSMMGGRNDFIGIAYISVGSASLIFAVCVMVFQKTKSFAVQPDPSPLNLSALS